MKARFFYTNREGIRMGTGWLKVSEEEVTSMYMDYVACNYTRIRVERTTVVDITEKIRRKAFES